MVVRTIIKIEGNIPELYENPLDLSLDKAMLLFSLVFNGESEGVASREYEGDTVYCTVDCDDYLAKLLF